MNNEEVKEEVERVPEEVQEVSKKVAEEVPEEVQAVAEEVEQKDEPKFLNVKKLKCNYTVYKTERTKLKMNIVENCSKCGKKFKDSDELYIANIKNNRTDKNYIICKKCAKK